ncbi:MAG: sodium:proton antiporter, partial [Planctomycetota bacterium]
MSDTVTDHHLPNKPNPLRIPNIIALVVLGLLVLAPLVVDLHGEGEAGRIEAEAAASPDGSMSPELSNTLADAEAGDADHGDHGGHGDHGVPPYWQIGTIPFVVLLLSIAVLPLLRSTMHWWEDNTNRLAVALGLGLLTIVFYAVVQGPVAALLAIEHAIPGEYIPFIMLLFSLYVISGGISITGDLKATPTVNAGFILVGTLIASFIGTTGASMLLIRP